VSDIKFVTPLSLHHWSDWPLSKCRLYIKQLKLAPTLLLPWRAK
jgi:hypothetical protein